MVITGIGGAFSVVAANSWMNQPQGFTLDAAGKVVDVEPLKVLFNPATGYEVPHMILAAYMVVGFLVASIYAVGMLKGRRDRLHRLGLLIPLTIALHRDPDPALRRRHRGARSRRPPAGQVRGDGVHPGNRRPTRPSTSAASAPPTGSRAAIAIPGLDSFLVGFSTDTKVTGLNDIPDDERPPANTFLHLSFDAMVGIGTALLALGAWFALRLVETARHPADAVVPARRRGLRRRRDRWRSGAAGSSPRSAASRGSSRATCAPPKRSPRPSGIWFSFGLVLLLYAALGTIAILVLRSMSRRWREGGAENVEATRPVRAAGRRGGPA